MGCWNEKKTEWVFENFRNSDLFLIFENAIKGGIAGYSCSKYVVFVAIKKKTWQGLKKVLMDLVCHKLQYMQRHKVYNAVSLGKTLSAPNKAGSECVLKVDLQHTVTSKKCLRLQFLSTETKIPKTESTDYMKITKTEHYHPTKKLICGLSNEENIFIYQTHSKLLNSQRMEVTEEALKDFKSRNLFWFR